MSTEKKDRVPVNVGLQAAMTDRLNLATTTTTTTSISFFTQTPMRRMRIRFTDVFSVFFVFSSVFRFFRPSQKYQTTVLGNG